MKIRALFSAGVLVAMACPGIAVAQPPHDVWPVGVDETGNWLDSSDLPAEPEIIGIPDAPGERSDSVIGGDGRNRVRDTTAPANRAIVYISLDGEAHCTGWMVSRDTLVTAGHCLVDVETGNWFRGLFFTPGANRSSRPFGSATAQQMWSDREFIRSADPRHDWGIVKLNRPLGDSTGWFDVSWQAATAGKSITVSGYPGDKPAGEMWTMTGRLDQTRSHQLCYSVDTMGGQSGSPVYLHGTKTAIGIHAYGTGPALNRQCSQNSNGGTRITKGIYDTIQKVK